jgi:hypothetical protein
MQANDTPEIYLQEAYLGEIGGEATFLGLVEALPERAGSLNLLAEVERVTAEYLSDHLLSPISPEVVEQRRAEGRNRATALSAENWAALLDSAIPVVEAAVAVFKTAEANAPDDLLEVYQTYTAHEQALADYMLLERDGQDGARVLQDYISRVGPNVS